MKIQAAKLHRLVVNAKIFQNVKGVGAEFHYNQSYLTMFSSDATTMITDSAGVEDGFWDEPQKWFWTPDMLKFWDMNLREVPDDDIIDLAIDQPLDGDFQVDTYLHLLDTRFYHSGGGEFAVWGNRLAKLRLIKPAGEFPIRLKRVTFQEDPYPDFLALRVGPTVRGIVTLVEEVKP